MLVPTCRSFALIIVLFVMMAGPSGVRGQPSGDWSPPALGEWLRILEEAETYLRGPQRTPDETGRQRALLESVTKVARLVRDQAGEQVVRTQKLLIALGPPPAEGEPPEAQDTASMRKGLSERVTLLRSRVAEANLALARVEALEDYLSQQARGKLRDQLERTYPLPFLPSVVGQAISELLGLFKSLARSPVDWYHGLDAEQRVKLHRWNAVGGLGVLASIAVAWSLSRLVQRRLGPGAEGATPSYARRLGAAISMAVAKGMIPSTFIAGLYLVFHRPETLLTGQLLAVLDGLLWALLLYILITATARAILEPDHPSWRLTDLAPDNARAIVRRITFLAAVMALDAFVEVSTRDWSRTPAAESFYLFVVSLLQVGGIVSLAPDRFWRSGRGDTAEPSRSVDTRFWRTVRLLVAAAALFALLPMLAGYIAAGRWVIEGLLGSILIVALFLLVRALGRDLIALLAASAFARRHLGLGPEADRRAVFWTSFAIDPLLVLVVLFLVAPLWGVPWDDLVRHAAGVAEGFRIGTITISPGALLFAIAVFAGVLVATRFFQRLLLENVLPNTKMAIGLQHTLVTGVSYVGYALALAVSISVAGIDLSNLAIVLGALSVGIGFGLQNVVNNFVSGLILLIERPIKVGDWVIIAGLEGVVKRINVRATEIETWQRASVVVPNAEVLSNPLTNLTLRDRYGRVDLAVGVAYGSDTQRVRSILLDCAAKEPRVVSYPSPYVVFQSFGDSSLGFELRCFTDDVMNRLRISSDLRFAIDQRFREEGIEIPFPQRVVHFADKEGFGMAAPAVPSQAREPLRTVTSGASPAAPQPGE